ncbi:NAD(P)H-quinone oxidoreductase [Mucilaginibacter arboris]|uniref:Zinc-binding dehydrogenase n=1 Tax=Mucilaginibacter arboris TaxID=2682090 RepID=A0A7K1SYR3_9SPHI|nr:NAD(P)H-quinone oxidoreductase [Mucilaginibacter arboris]MVN22464.1 zinc-binding dehydrogenase [Mucilaginibacter arboris]
MKAIIITKPGAPEVLKIKEREKPQPKPNEVLIRIKAAGVNRPDVFQRKGNYPAPTNVPQDIPGLEVAGIVGEIGAEVTQWKTGDKVCALLGGGGYAEFAVVDARHCLPVPSNWSFVEAASLPETVFTVWQNVFLRGSLKSGEIFLVHGGSSGIGITAIQLAKAFGAEVYATAGSEEKCKACEDLGAKRSINYKKEDFEEVLKDIGVDVILDMVGGDYILKNIRLLKADGRLVYINAMQGGKAEIDVSDIMKKRLTLTGSTLRNRDASFKAQLSAAIKENVWPVLEAGKFKPVIYKTFKLEDAAAAHQLMESSEHIGKIMLEI